ncbi:MAG: MBOAT family protein [Acetobacteraceae bacterium]
MLFTEPLFLFIFLPAVFGLWLSLPGLRLWLLLAASLVFYAWGEPRFVPVVIASALLDYALAQRIARGARWALPLGVAANLAVLVYYKYMGFLGATLSLTVPAVALPIGVSFVVFEKITYLVDVARGLSPAAAGFGRYLAYVMFFPKLLAGPIIKYHEIEAQFRSPRHARVFDGFARFMLGVIKKVLLADVLGTGADAVFAMPPGTVGFVNAWAGVLLFTLQIYLDFSAYSDMAIGLARMFGFDLRENFNRPYISCSITEFWRRWHISLSTWIREYLYIPLGGNRVGAMRRLLNLWICFFASGLWHGAAWTYVLWGAYHGVFLVLEKLFLLRLLDRLPRLAANALTLLVVMVGWTIFRTHSLGQLEAFLAAMVQPARAGAGLFWQNDVRVAACVGVVICAGAAPAAIRPGVRGAGAACAAAGGAGDGAGAVSGRPQPGGGRPVQAIPVFPVLNAPPADSARHAAAARARCAAGRALAGHAAGRGGAVRRAGHGGAPGAERCRGLVRRVPVSIHRMAGPGDPRARGCRRRPQPGVFLAPAPIHHPGCRDRPQADAV